MLAGKSLLELATEIERQANAKRDFLATAPSLEFHSNGHTAMQVADQGSWNVNDIAHGQIAEYLGVPQRWYDTMRQHTEDWQTEGRTQGGGNLFDTTVNTLMMHRTDKRLVRTLDGNARAFLSDRYRPIDHYEIAMPMFELLATIPGIQGQHTSAEITERKMYVRIVSDRLTAEVKVGDIVQRGIQITNSEVGYGKFKVERLLFQLKCTNGMVSNIAGQGRSSVTHLGGKLGEDGIAFQYLREDTIRARNDATIKELRDMVALAFTKDQFDDEVQAIRGASEIRMSGDPVRVVEEVTNRYRLADTEKVGVLRHLIEGGDLSYWGLVQAVTATAQDVSSFDRSVELETLGGELIALPASTVRSIVTVGAN